MLDRRWLYYAAYGGWLVLAILLAGPVLAQKDAPDSAPSAVSEQGSTSPENSQPDTKEQDEAAKTPAPEAQAPVSAPVSTPAADKVAEKPNRYPDCEFNTVAECDLAAQHSMANSTFVMMWAALAGVTLTVVGIILLWRTLLYTRNAADAARETVDLSREMAESTKASVEWLVKVDRPFLAVINLKMGVAGIGGDYTDPDIPGENATSVYILGQIQNQGTRLAFVKDVRMAHFFNLGDIPPEITGPSDWLEMHRFSPPNSTSDTLELFRFNETIGGVRDLIRGGGRFDYIVGYIRYADTLGTNRRSGFAFALQGPEPVIFVAYGGDAYWYDTEENNEAT